MSDGRVVWCQGKDDVVGDLAHQLMEGLDRLRTAWRDAADAETEWTVTQETLAVLASVGHLLAVYDAIQAAADESREGL